MGLGTLNSNSRGAEGLRKGDMQPDLYHELKSGYQSRFTNYLVLTVKSYVILSLTLITGSRVCACMRRHAERQISYT